MERRLRRRSHSGLSGTGKAPAWKPTHRGWLTMTALAGGPGLVPESVGPPGFPASLANRANAAHDRGGPVYRLRCRAASKSPRSARSAAARTIGNPTGALTDARRK